MLICARMIAENQCLSLTVPRTFWHLLPYYLHLIRLCRAIQTARAVVASERQRILNKTQLVGDKEWTPAQSFDQAKRASEEELFEEVGLLMQERDLLLREKSALQAILASSETSCCFSRLH